MNKKALWITRTAVFTALLIVMQALTAPLGNTLLTGAIVNFILIATVMICGLASGVTVAAISPACAKLIGIGPLWSLIPFIIAGNIVLVLIWNYIGNHSFGKEYVRNITAAVIAALGKFIVLYLGIVRFAVPLLLQLPEPQASVISGTFSIPQLFTALVGGALAVITLPVLKKLSKEPD